MANNRDRHQSEFEEKVVSISRVSKKTKGGDQMGFTALLVVGDRKGKVGIGLGKAKDVMTAIQKGVKQAKRKMISVPIDGTTIPFRIEAQSGAGKVLLKPAAKGSGVIAGGPVRAVVEVAGIKDVSAKILGSNNQSASVYATFSALKKISSIMVVRGIKVERESDETEVSAETKDQSQTTRDKKPQPNDKSENNKNDKVKKTALTSQEKKSSVKKDKPKKIVSDEKK